MAFEAPRLASTPIFTVDSATAQFAQHTNNVSDKTIISTLFIYGPFLHTLILKKAKNVKIVPRLQCTGRGPPNNLRFQQSLSIQSRACAAGASHAITYCYYNPKSKYQRLFEERRRTFSRSMPFRYKASSPRKQFPSRLKAKIVPIRIIDQDAPSSRT